VDSSARQCTFEIYELTDNRETSLRQRGYMWETTVALPSVASK
jgi:hypothetical protein